MAQIFLQARASSQVRMVLALGARDQVFLRHYIVCRLPLGDPGPWLMICSDPFLKMIETNKTYGFTIAVKELKETVPNIFRYASAYKRVNNLTSQGLWEMFIEPQPEEKEEENEDKHPLPEEILRGDPSRESLPDIDPEAMEGEKYNMCHFWSNFEIAKLSWFRSKEYEDFFQMMDRSGGFWMERVSLLMKTVLALYTDYQIVGRCTHPLPGRWSSSRSPGYPLLQRFRVPTHHHPTLSSKCSSTSTGTPSIP